MTRNKIDRPVRRETSTGYASVIRANIQITPRNDHHSYSIIHSIADQPADHCAAIDQTANTRPSARPSVYPFLANVCDYIVCSCAWRRRRRMHGKIRLITAKTGAELESTATLH